MLNLHFNKALCIYDTKKVLYKNNQVKININFKTWLHHKILHTNVKISIFFTLTEHTLDERYKLMSPEETINI